MAKRLLRCFKANFNLISGRFVFDVKKPGAAPGGAGKKMDVKPGIEAKDKGTKSPGEVRQDWKKLEGTLDPKAVEAQKAKYAKSIVKPGAKPAVTPKKAPEKIIKRPEEYVLDHWDKQRTEMAKEKASVKIEKRGVMFPNEDQRAAFFFVDALAELGYGPAASFRKDMLGKDGAQLDSMFNGDESPCAKILGFYWDAGKHHWRMNESGGWYGDSDDSLGKDFDGADSHSFVASFPTLIKMYQNRSGELDIDGTDTLKDKAPMALAVAQNKHELLSVKSAEEFEYEGVTHEGKPLELALKWMEGKTADIIEAIAGEEGKWMRLGSGHKKAVEAMLLLDRDGPNPMKYMYMRHGQTIFMRPLRGKGPMRKIDLGGERKEEGEMGKSTFAGLWHPINFTEVSAKDTKGALEVVASDPKVQNSLPAGVVPSAAAAAASEAIKQKEEAEHRKYIDAVLPKVSTTVGRKSSLDEVEARFNSKIERGVEKAFIKEFKPEEKEAQKAKPKVIAIIVAKLKEQFKAKKAEVAAKYEKIKKVKAVVTDGVVEIVVIKGEEKGKEKKPSAKDQLKNKLDPEVVKKVDSFLGSSLGQIVAAGIGFGLLDEKKVRTHLMGIFSGKKKGIFSQYIAYKVGGVPGSKLKKGEKPKGLLGKIFGTMDIAVDKGLALAEQGGVSIEEAKAVTVATLNENLGKPLAEPLVVGLNEVGTLKSTPATEMVAQIQPGKVYKAGVDGVQYKGPADTEWKTASKGTKYYGVKLRVSSMGGDTIPVGAVLANEARPTPSAVKPGAPAASKAPQPTSTKSVTPKTSN